MKSVAISLDLLRGTGKVNGYLAAVTADSIDDVAATVQTFLHPREHEYVASLQAEKRKTRYLLGRYAAKCAIALYASESDLTKIEIAIGFFEQPVVHYPTPDVPDVSIGHSEDLTVAVAFPRGHIMGLDIRCIDLDKAHVYRSQLTEPEQQQAETQFDDYRRGYHVIWTAKESLSKALKCGLTVPFEILQLDQLQLVSEGQYACTYRNFAQYKGCMWIVADHVLAITLPRKTELLADVTHALRSCLIR